MYQPDEPFLATSASLCEGHPDKVCDAIADAIVDACLLRDPLSRVDCTVTAGDDTVVVTGDITCAGDLDLDAAVRGAVAGIGYSDPADRFCAGSLRVELAVTRHIPDPMEGLRPRGGGGRTVTGFAADETPGLMPLPYILAHRLARLLAEDRMAGRAGWLRPDGGTEVSVAYAGGRPAAVTRVVVRAQHAPGAPLPAIREYVETDLVPRALGEWHRPEIEIVTNPDGAFERGGPSAAPGASGRQHAIDTGGAPDAGQAALPGKDPGTVDRAGSYACRKIAHQIVARGIAHRAEVRVEYGPDGETPVSASVDTFGSGDQAAAEDLLRREKLTIPEVVRDMELRCAKYRPTACFGHFGRPGFPWNRSIGGPGRVGSYASQDPIYGFDPTCITRRLTHQNWRHRAVARVLGAAVITAYVHRTNSYGWGVCGRHRPLQYTVCTDALAGECRSFQAAFDTLEEALAYANCEDGGALATMTRRARPREIPAERETPWTIGPITLGTASRADDATE